jgi:hypothetical protein
MDTFGNINFSSTAKNILNKLQGRQITITEALQECAYWAIKDGFDELRVRPLPTRPHSQAFNEYELLPPKQRLKVDAQFFYKNPEINDYYTQVNMVRNKNKAVYSWLQDLKKYIPAEDIVSHEKIDMRLQDFKNWLYEENDLIDKAREIFSSQEAEG